MGNMVSLGDAIVVGVKQAQRNADETDETQSTMSGLSKWIVLSGGVGSFLANNCCKMDQGNNNWLLGEYLWTIVKNVLYVIYA